MSKRSHRLTFWLILVGYILITFAYSVMTPLFEAPDEHNHFFVVLHHAETGRLPIVDGGEHDYLHQEAAQPPLYYWLGGWLVRPFALAVEGTGEQLWFNRFVQMGNADSPTNINRFVHGSAENWPYRGWVAAAHLLRLFSTTFGLITLLGIYQSARTMWQNHPDRALLAMGLIALLPQFNFLHAYINNDVAAICFATLTLWQLIKLWKTETPTFSTFILIGVLVALTMLSKTVGLLLLVYAVGFIFVWAWQHHQWQRGIRAIGIVASIAMLLAGWLLWRNWQLYGDITAANQFVLIAGGNREMTLLGALAETSGIVWSMFGVFGWFNITAPNWIYAVWFGLIGISIAGSIRSRQSFQWLPFLLVGWPCAVYAGMLAFMLRTPAAQGRLLFPALAPFALGLSYGLSALAPRINSRVWLAAPLLTTLFAVSVVIPNSYRRMDTVQQLPDETILVEQSLLDGIELVGYRLLGNRYQANDYVWIELFWRATQEVEVAPDLVLELFGRNNTLIGKLQTLHGSGLHPATEWPLNTILTNRIAVQIDEAVETPTQARVSIRLVDGGSVDLGHIKVGSAADFEVIDGEPLAQFGEGIALISAEVKPVSAEPGDTITVDLRWHVMADQHQTLSTLVHLGETGSPPIAQGDGTPKQGDYPTHWWAAGETVDDQYTLVLPADISAGTYPLRVGFYDAAFVRLPTMPDDGDQTFEINMIEVKTER